MTTRQSQFNNTGLPLIAGATFTGSFERTLTGLEVTSFVNCSGLCLVTIEQSIDASNVRITTTFNYDPVNDVSTFSVPVALPFFRVKLFNGDIATQAYLTLNTYIINTPPQQVVVAGGSLDVVVTGGTVDVSGNTFSDGNLKVLDSGVYKPTDDGVNTHFEITASAVNNAAVYYADETQGVDVAGGWQFTSTLHGSGTKNTKINWYMYQPTTNVVITDLSNNPTNTYYTIVDNVGVEFPLIYIYTKPTVPATKIVGGTAGSSWYQSKFVYQANQVGTVGTYLLYAGANPTTIRPDLTHINLRQLDILCLGTLQPDEIVMSASLQTSSNLLSPAGNFSLTMSEFGVVIAPVDTTLRTDATGALAVSVSGSVAVTGTFYQAVQDVSGNVGIQTSANTIKIDQTSVATNGVRTIAPDTFSARVTAASSTGVLVTAGGHLLNFVATNTSATVDAYIKLYDSVSIPVPASDVPFMIVHVSRDATVLTPVIQVNTANLKITNNLWVRAVVGSADTNTDATGVNLDICFFGTAT